MEEQPQKTNRTIRRKIKAARVVGLTKMLVLDPEHHYAREQERVLRVMANWIAKRGVAVVASMLAKHCRWNRRTLDFHLEDLLASGEVEFLHGRVWVLTQKAFTRIKKQYIYPVLPTELQAKPTSIRHAKRIARDLADPEIRAHFEAMQAAASERRANDPNC